MEARFPSTFAFRAAGLERMHVLDERGVGRR
jgi:hypothetical protein